MNEQGTTECPEPESWKNHEKNGCKMYVLIFRISLKCEEHKDKPNER